MESQRPWLVLRSTLPPVWRMLGGTGFRILCSYLGILRAGITVWATSVAADQGLSPFTATTEPWVGGLTIAEFFLGCAIPSQNPSRAGNCSKRGCSR